MKTIPKTTEPILFFAHSTSKQDYNSGIQTVLRQTAKAMLEDGVDLVPVGISRGQIIPLTEIELKALSAFSGPQPEMFGDISEFAGKIKKAKKMLVIELTSGGSRNMTLDIIKFCKKNQIKSTFVFYDAIPLYYPNLYSEKSIANLYLYMDALSYADLILPISKSSKSEIQLYFKNRNKIAKKIQDLLLPTEIIDVKNILPKNNNTNNIKILFVSSIDPRKNHLMLVDAFKEAHDILKKKGINISLSLPHALYSHEIRKKIQNKIDKYPIKLIENCSQEELYKLYKDADFTVYPSLHEGFGLPIVESLFFNTPVLCSNTTSLPEVAGDGGCIMFNPFNKEELIENIIKLSSDKTLILKLQKEIKERKIVTWKDYAKQICTQMGVKFL